MSHVSTVYLELLGLEQVLDHEIHISLLVGFPDILFEKGKEAMQTGTERQNRQDLGRINVRAMMREKVQCRFEKGFIVVARLQIHAQQRQIDSLALDWIFVIEFGTIPTCAETYAHMHEIQWKANFSL